MKEVYLIRYNLNNQSLIVLPAPVITAFRHLVLHRNCFFPDQENRILPPAPHKFRKGIFQEKNEARQLVAKRCFANKGIGKITADGAVYLKPRIKADTDLMAKPVMLLLLHKQLRPVVLRKWLPGPCLSFQLFIEVQYWVPDLKSKTHKPGILPGVHNHGLVPDG